MDRITRKPVAATLVALAAIFVLLYTGNTVDFLSGVTKPAVIAFLNLLGVGAQDHGVYLTAGKLNVPWTGDCAGLNILAILLAVTVWANRAGPFGVGFWLRIVLALPIAYVANLFRILSLIGLRWLIYPAVESPQLHYFIGFLWVLPFLALLAKRPKDTSPGIFWLEILRIAAVLSLLAPFVSAPGGTLVTVCALLLLARHRWHSPAGAFGILLFCGWIAVGVFIGRSRMESLWIPWILACPAYLDLRPSRLAPMVVLLTGTVPLFSMKWWAPFVLLPFLVWEVWGLLSSAKAAEKTADRPGALFPIVAFFQLFPFLAAVVALAPGERFAPPPGVMAIESKGFYAVRLVRQPADLECYWYEPNESGRHHTLEVCLQYRGVHAKLVQEGNILSDGKRWMGEFFLMPDGELCDYHAYLQRTFLPFSPNGVHLIYTAPKETMTREQFSQAIEENARELSRLTKRPRS